MRTPPAMRRLLLAVVALCLVALPVAAQQQGATPSEPPKDKEEVPFWAIGRPSSGPGAGMAPVPAFPIPTPADKLPIAIPSGGDGHVFLYLATRDVPVDFRAFLERHAELLRSLGEWRVRLLLPLHLQRASAAYRTAFHEQPATPLRPVVLEELRWYFGARQRGRDGHDIRFHHAARAFAAPRFGVLYRAWLEQGDTVLQATLSPTLA